MERQKLMRESVLIDTSGFIGFIAPLDEHHQIAKLAMAEVLKRRVQIVTTSAILFEFLDGAALRDRRSSRALHFLLSNFQIEVIHVDEPLMENAWMLFDSRPDKGWSLTDCVSFVLMQERGIHEALTYDHHFEQAGFRALMRSDRN